MTSPTEAPPHLRTSRGLPACTKHPTDGGCNRRSSGRSRSYLQSKTRDQFLRPMGAPPAGPFNEPDAAGGWVQYHLVERHRATTDAALGAMTQLSSFLKPGSGAPRGSARRMHVL